MEEKIEREFQRQELADYLENLAQQVRSGAFQVQGAPRQVPERLNTKIELKEKKGYVSAKVRFRWAVLNEYDEKTRAKMVRQQEDFKGLKQQLAQVFAELLKSIEQEAFPAESKVTHLQEYLDHVENLHLALKNKQLEMFQHELRDLKVRVKACHQEYR
jgi:amphi-Trp domain-containing protein